MKKTIAIPNQFKYIAAVAMATEPSDTLAFLLEVGALAQREITVMRGLAQGLREYERLMLDQPRPSQDDRTAYNRYWSHLGVVQDALRALETPDAQAYLAVKARAPFSPEDLAHTMAAIGVAGRHRSRPWDDTWGEYEVDIWREIFSSPDQSTPALVFGSTPLIGEVVG